MATQSVRGRVGRRVWLQWLQIFGMWVFDILWSWSTIIPGHVIFWRVFFGWSRTKFGDFVGFWLLDFTGFWIFWSGFFDILWPWSYFNWGEVKYWRKVWIIVVKFRLVLRVFYWWWWRWGRLELEEWKACSSYLECTDTDTCMDMGTTQRHEQFFKNSNMKWQVQHRYNMNTTWIWHEYDTLNEVSMHPRFLHGQWSKHQYWCCFLLNCKGFWCRTSGNNKNWFWTLGQIWYSLGFEELGLGFSREYARK